MAREDKHQSQLKLLIARGKDQGYLTIEDIHEVLSSASETHAEDLADLDVETRTHKIDPERMDAIYTAFQELGIPIYQAPPDPDSLIFEGTVSDIGDEEIVQAAAAALATVDSEFGRTTDPVRMYMREMGTVELLTRQGEIEIAKRIEEGILQTLRALAHYPEVIGALLDDYDRITLQETRLNEVILGYVDELSEQETETALPEGDGAELGALSAIGGAAAEEEESADEEDAEEAEIDTGPDPEVARIRFTELREQYMAVMAAEKRYGRHHKTTQKKRDQLAETFMAFRLAPRQFEKLAQKVRSL
ncbi:MAG: RNA polymerase sigma factor region1.1 domain-containing protein, partial [Gammaproteobacteria bacterium]